MASLWLSCLCLWRSPERAPLLNVRPTNTFPPPHTILTAPVPRVRPLAHLASLLRRPGTQDLADAAHRSYEHSQHSAHGSESSANSRPLSILEYAERRREERLESTRRDGERKEAERKRQKVISTAYGSLMCKVDRHSLPPTPTFVDEGYRRTSTSSSADQLHAYAVPAPVAVPVPTHMATSYSHSPIHQRDHRHSYAMAATYNPNSHTTPNYGAIGLGICPPVESMTVGRPLATPPAGFSSRRPPTAPGLIVTPAPASFVPDPAIYPSTVPPLSCGGPVTPVTPMTEKLHHPKDYEHEHDHERDYSPSPSRRREPRRGRVMSRSRNYVRASATISSRDSSMSRCTRSTGPSRSTSMSREILSEGEYHDMDVDVVYKQIGLAGLASATTPKRRRFKHRKRARISWVDEKEA